MFRKRKGGQFKGGYATIAPRMVETESGKSEEWQKCRKRQKYTRSTLPVADVTIFYGTNLFGISLKITIYFRPSVDKTTVKG